MLLLTHLGACSVSIYGVFAFQVALLHRTRETHTLSSFNNTKLLLHAYTLPYLMGDGSYDLVDTVDVRTFHIY